MAELFRAPKQWALTRTETISSYEAWQQNLIYNLSSDPNFKPFIDDNELEWKSPKIENRGFEDDKAPIPTADRKSGKHKATQLDRLLGQIANFCPIITRSIITKKCTSLKEIWQNIRAHYNFQAAGSRFLDLADFTMQVDESHEDLFQRIMSFFEDNLMTKSGTMTHNGKTIEEDEEFTPTLENVIVFLWLQLAHPALPKFVKQKYAAELRNKSLASLKPEISSALPSLLQQLQEDSTVLRANVFRPHRPSQEPLKSCILCKTAERPFASHYLSECKYLPDRDKRFMARNRMVNNHDETDHAYETDPDEEPSDPVPDPLMDTPSIRKVDIIQSPYINTYYGPHCVQLTIDTGATTSMVHARFAKQINLPISPASQLARQADGSPLAVKGEVHCAVSRGKHKFQLDALVVDKLDTNILAGTTFLHDNDIAVRPAKRLIVIKGVDKIYYGAQGKSSARLSKAQAYLVCASASPTSKSDVLPLEMKTLNYINPDDILALEPCSDNPYTDHMSEHDVWPDPQCIQPNDKLYKVPLSKRFALHPSLNQSPEGPIRDLNHYKDKESDDTDLQPHRDGNHVMPRGMLIISTTLQVSPLGIPATPPMIPVPTTKNE